MRAGLKPRAARPARSSCRLSPVCHARVIVSAIHLHECCAAANGPAEVPERTALVSMEGRYPSRAPSFDVLDSHTQRGDAREELAAPQTWLSVRASMKVPMAVTSPSTLRSTDCQPAPSDSAAYSLGEARCANPAVHRVRTMSWSQPVGAQPGRARPNCWLGACRTHTRC